MDMLKTAIRGVSGVSILIILLFSTPLRAGVILPEGQGFVVGDFTIYSLAELNVIAGEGPPGPGDSFYVASSPGALLGADAVVIATGTNNAGVVDNPVGMDDAYSTPTGGAPFDTNTYSDPGGQEAFTGDGLNTWDSETSAIRTHLDDDGEFVVYFNMNDTGSDGLGGIDLLIWAEFTLSGDNVADVSFLLSGDFGGAGVDDSIDGGYDDWVYAFGTICASSDASVVYHGGPCTTAEKAGGAADINQNLGANAAAFAIFNQDLNDLILDGNSGYTALSIDARLYSINNGYEQAFILSDTSIGRTRVSEPGMLSLAFGAMLFMVWRRRSFK
ncbi:MAG: hypothetical protein JKY59_09415 [Emcibacter sp.]|nr:hypothetical protein [Emcibacter sp.]